MHVAPGGGVRRGKPAAHAAPAPPRPTPLRREAKLRVVKVAKEDVDLLVSSWNLKKEVADRLLRVHGGDVAAAMRFAALGDAAPGASAAGLLAAGR